MPKRKKETDEEKRKRLKEKEKKSRKLLGSGMAGRAADVLTKRRAFLQGL